jgi:hypothetical protein
MSNEKTSYNPVQGDYPQDKLTDIPSPKSEDSPIEKIKQTYLPDSKANHRPSEESIERANGLDSSKPNPVEELISNKK